MMIISNYGELIASVGDRMTHFGDSAKKGSLYSRYVLDMAETMYNLVCLYCWEISPHKVGLRLMKWSINYSYGTYGTATSVIDARIHRG